jgi:selenocysteine-specific elongation factor
VIIGTGGHIDHGKTALVRALTGIDTDRLKEEKARGISIDLGFAYLPASDGSVLGFVDVPGHEKFVHNMLAGSTGIDFVLLVIAADDGVMPQTREHLSIIDLLGIARGIVALTKIDLVSAERLQAVRLEIARALEATALVGAEILPVSSVSGEGVDRLRDRLFAEAALIRSAALKGRFRLAIDRCFTLGGIGTVVTGTVLSGTAAVGEHVTISPSGASARIRSIHAQNRHSERGRAGERCALNLVGDGIDKDAIQRGDIALDPALHAPTDRIDATLRVLFSERRPIAHWMPVRLHHAAAEVGARVVLLGEPIAPGAEGRVQLVLDRPIAASVGDRFVVRDTSAQRTIGGGRFLDLRAPTRKRRTPERMAQLDAQAIQDAELALGALLACAPNYVDLTIFARDRTLSGEELDQLVKKLELIPIPLRNAVFALLPLHWLQFRRDVAKKLAEFHAGNPDQQGIGMERLRLRIEPRLPASVFVAALQSLSRAGEISLEGAWVRLPGHTVRLTATEEALWRRIHPLIAGRERFRPPRVRDIGVILGTSENDVRALLKLLGRLGKVDEVAHDHFFLRATVTEMVKIAVDIAGAAPQGQFGAATFRDRLDNGRKVTIQILEFFDRHGVTLRRGDLRRVNRHRLNLFVPPGDEQSLASESGRESSPVGRPDFKSGGGREPVFGGFDSHSLPPRHLRAR